MDIPGFLSVRGSGEPVLLVGPVLADGFAPLVAEPALAERYRLIHYHRLGWAGSTRTPGPVGIPDHVADALALLDCLGVEHVHAVGQSSGAAVVAQLAEDHPERVATAALLELSLLTRPAGRAFLAEAAPVLEASANGETERALGMFLAAVSGMSWAECRAVLEERVPGSVAQAVKDADTLFAVEFPALAEWRFGADDAAALRQPVLSVLGADTRPLWTDVAGFLRATVPDVQEHTVPGVGHLLPPRTAPARRRGPGRVPGPAPDPVLSRMRCR
ncbi:alpha/beta fold hydrolase [Kitasatospora camelliae]|uniref:Alpha/beta fold hydrolase n=1 Tax=Kitasatospora camelliae TaxID=3156397 RepID=A0AAU8K4Y9_9ACTN